MICYKCKQNIWPKTYTKLNGELSNFKLYTSRKTIPSEISLVYFYLLTSSTLQLYMKALV